MGFIKDIVERARERKRRAAEYEENERIIDGVAQKKQSHYERELKKSLESERQKYIKEALYLENKKQQLQDKMQAQKMRQFTPELFQNKNILEEKNVFLRGGDF